MVIGDLVETFLFSAFTFSFFLFFSFTIRPKRNGLFVKGCTVIVFRGNGQVVRFAFLQTCNGKRETGSLRLLRSMVTRRSIVSNNQVMVYYAIFRRSLAPFIMSLLYLLCCQGQHYFFTLLGGGHFSRLSGERSAESDDRF